MRAPVLLGVLLLAACGGETGGVLGETAERAAIPEPITFELRPVGADGVSGTATIEPARHDPTRTTVSVSPEAESLTLARGSCSSLAAADTAVELAGGAAPFSVLELLEGDFAVVLHRAGAAVSCGDVPDPAHLPEDL